MAKEKYDIILFGCTGFTGKLAVEYLLKRKNTSIQWAVCARNESKAQAVLQEIVDAVGEDATESIQPPPLLIANLVCENDQEEETLRQVVQQTKVVLTCSGPFEKYGKTLVKLCAELGVHYGDITGETDFFRSMIQQYDSVAKQSGAQILCHCGNDCIPQDLTVYELHRYAASKGAELRHVKTFGEFSESSAWSGGTLETASYQLGKDRTGAKPTFDPLLTDPDGSKSEYATKNISGKQNIDMDLGKAGPWIMGPVMVNCVRRSNALLHYSKQLEYGDLILQPKGWMGWLNQAMAAAQMGAATALPFLRRFLPGPGEGPSREAMEAGYLSLHGRAVMVKGDKETPLRSKFHFGKDTAYLYTAAMLVETGILLVEKSGSASKQQGGVITPAVALGGDLTERLVRELECSWELNEVPSS